MKRVLSGLALIVLLLSFFPIGSASISLIEDPSKKIVDLRLDRISSNSQVVAGEQFSWSLLVENLGPNTANQVIVSEFLPIGISIDRLEPTQGKCMLKHEILTSLACELGRIESGQQASIDLTANVAADLETSELFSTAYVIDEAGSVDFNLKNNSVSGSLSVEARISNIDLLVSPLCTAPGSSVLVTGNALVAFAGTVPEVSLNGQMTNATFLGESALSITIPELASGSAQIQIGDVTVNPAIQIDPSCAIRAINLEEVRSGFVPGDLLLFFKKETEPGEIEQFGKDYGFESVTEYPLLGLHRGRLLQDANLENEELESSVSCPVSRRTTAIELDLTILVDRSGTMDSIWLRDVMNELLKQMNCVMNEASQVSLASYSSDFSQELDFAPWSEQRANIEAWLDRPLSTTGTSDLESALLTTADLLSNTGSTKPKQIFLLTRGPSIPEFYDEQALIERIVDREILLSGIANINRFFIFDTYAPVRKLANETGRDFFYIDFRFPLEIPAVVTCAIASGIYGVDPCGPGAFGRIPTKVVDFSRQTEILLQKISEDARIEQVCVNSVVEHSQFGDPNVEEQTWLKNLGVENIQHFFPRLGDGITIALIDTGLDFTLNELGEVELDPSVPLGLNIAIDPENGAAATDVAGHGTKVASVSAAHENSVNGVGVAPRAKLIPIRVFAQTADGVRGNSLWVAEAIAAAFLMGADVINMSLGDRSRIQVGCKKVSSRDFYERIFNNLSAAAGEEFNRRAPIFVAATGNDAKRVRCPACVDSVIAVGSVVLNAEGVWERSSFSNVGDEIDFTAQGEDILTTLEGGNFGDTGPGTSFAAPQVTGLIALILGENPGLQTDEIVEKIKLCFSEDVAEPGWDRETGWGRIRIPAPDQALPECLPAR